MSNDETVHLWKDRFGALREQVVALISVLSEKNPPPSAATEAASAIESFRKAAAKSNLETFRQFDLALSEIVAEGGVTNEEVMSFVDHLIRDAELAMVEPKRIDIARRLSEVANIARTRGLWVEYLLLRSIAWIIVEPTGIAAVALRQQMYSDPVTIPLLLDFYDGDCGPIGAATDLAMLLRELARLIHGNNPPLN